jgi:hypothetical protein
MESVHTCNLYIYNLSFRLGRNLSYRHFRGIPDAPERVRECRNDRHLSLLSGLRIGNRKNYENLN